MTAESTVDYRRTIQTILLIQNSLINEVAATCSLIVLYSIVLMSCQNVIIQFFNRLPHFTVPITMSNFDPDDRDAWDFGSKWARDVFTLRNL